MKCFEKYNTRIACNNPSTLKLVNAFKPKELCVDEKGNHFEIYVYGEKSDAAKNASANMRRKLEQMSDKLQPGERLTEEQKAQVGTEFLAALIAGWSDNITDDKGKTLEYNINNAIALIESEDWIADQVQIRSKNLKYYDPNA